MPSGLETSIRQIHCNFLTVTQKNWLDRVFYSVTNGLFDRNKRSGRVYGENAYPRVPEECL